MTADVPLVGLVAPESLHCMTMNVRRPVPHLRPGHPDAWARRAPAVATLVRSEAPHLLAVQEAVPTQVDHLATALGSRWQPVVAGRGARGGGERVGCFVDTERLRVARSRTIALAPDPGRIGSRAWGAPFPRIAVLVELDDLVTGVRFLGVATHVDPFSPLARTQSAELLGRVVQDAGLPAVAMADWNAGERSASAQVLRAGGLRDTWDLVSDPPTSLGTYAHYGQPRPGRPRLDRVLVHTTPETGVTVERVAISTRRPAGAWPSDHLPVHAVLRWEPR
ncbi:endonuclease/exonuclease/phosphatase family protein [Curtobacterium sp. 9128]|uniref:endonuclease/exonuclease/phosphatase family protein n=1 Tax=Curtobacterium sp. 9128 TaxID=1793722 RepID=UPI0011A7F2F9|nr:endonuclease/exonuclease/phosphatase family protein [Curtobacterium sp. 9128]